MASDVIHRTIPYYLFNIKVLLLTKEQSRNSSDEIRAHNVDKSEVYGEVLQCLHFYSWTFHNSTLCYCSYQETALLLGVWPWRTLPRDITLIFWASRPENSCRPCSLRSAEQWTGKSRPSGWHSCSVFGRSSRWANLTEVFLFHPQFSQPSAVIS